MEACNPLVANAAELSVVVEAAGVVYYNFFCDPAHSEISVLGLVFYGSCIDFDLGLNHR